MTHRAEQILDAVASAVTGLATTGNNVFRGREHAESAIGRMPSLLLHLGDDAPDEENSAWPRLYSDLDVTIEVAVDTAGGYETTLLDIREEITKALRADYTLGLSFVQDIMEGSAERPELADDSGRAFTQRLAWTVRYWRSWDDPSA